MAGATKAAGLRAVAMAKGISEIAGEASGIGESRVAVYRALRALICARCAETIREGELFTKRSLPGRELRILPQCRKCVPFEVRAVQDRKRQQSVLLESVLTPESELNEVRADKPDAMRETVERRLGPALQRSRQRTRS
jgi:RNase P subunit RPR2